MQYIVIEKIILFHFLLLIIQIILNVIFKKKKFQNTMNCILCT